MRIKKDSYVVNGGMELGTVNPGFEGDAGQQGATDVAVIPHTVLNGNDSLGVTGDVEATDTGPERQQWSSGVEFLMSCIAMSVGLGNIWRFPYTAFKNGGGAFVIPYIIVLMVIGKPLYYMEMALGQFTSYGCIKVWNMIPALKGMGVGQVFATILVLTYYCSLMALTVFYMVSSFAAELPWARCDESWTNCFDSVKMISENTTVGVNTRDNETGQSSSEMYFLTYLLNEPPNIDNGIGAPGWQLTLCLLFSWITIFLVIMRGVKGSGKAAYFLALFPYVVLTALLVRGCTLPGAADGVLYFIRPQWDKLIEPNVWYEAVAQAFFSLSVSFGTLIVYASYNDFNHNIHRDAIIVTTMDTFTSLMAGCTIFAILGNLAYETQKDIKDVVTGGTGLAFISYPDAIAKFDVVPQLFSVLFFFMLYTLGIGSAVALIGAVVTIICDQFPKLKYWMVALVACIVGFLVGLVYITPGGQFVLNLVDYYGVTFVVFILSCVEMMSVAWIYGVDNLCQDLEFMLGQKVSVYWRLCWGIITPLLLFVILLYALVNFEPQKYNDVLYPASAYAAGYALMIFGVIQFPIGVAYQFIKNRHLSFKEMVKVSFSPNELWRPKNPKKYKEWLEFKENRRRERELAGETKCQRILRQLCGVSCLRGGAN